MYLLIEAWVILAILSDFMLEEDPTALESSTWSLAMRNIFYLIIAKFLDREDRFIPHNHKSMLAALTLLGAVSTYSYPILLFRIPLGLCAVNKTHLETGSRIQG